MVSSDTLTISPNGHVPPGGRKLQDRVPIDAITADARQATPGRAVLALIGYVLFTIGWTAAMGFKVLFFSGAWCFSGVKMGWRTARGEPLDQPDVRAVLEENARLRLELERVS